MPNDDTDDIVTVESKEPDINKSLRILFVEDDRLARMAGQYVLKKENCESFLACDVAQAKKLLDTKKFDLVITDIGLPDGSGIDVIQYVKSNRDSLNYTTFFFALTAHNDKSKLLEIMTAGFNEAISKPLTEETLNTLLNDYFTEFLQPLHSVEALPVVFDIVTTKKFFNGDDGLINAIFNTLLKSLAEDILILKKAEADNDIVVATQILHKMIGGLSYCVVPLMQRAVQTLCLALKSNDNLKDSSHLFIAVYNENERLQQLNLKQYMQSSQITTP
jgi:CheY-like chemotaxis protein